MMTEQKLFDLSLLEQIDDKDFIAQVIVIYLQHSPEELEQMKRAVDAGDMDIVFKTAHKLKGSTGMLQANKLFAILDQTGKLAKEGRETARIHKLVLNARYEFDQLKTALELHLKEIETMTVAF